MLLRHNTIHKHNIAHSLTYTQTHTHIYILICNTTGNFLFLKRRKGYPHSMMSLAFLRMQFSSEKMKRDRDAAPDNPGRLTWLERLATFLKEESAPIPPPPIPPPRPSPPPPMDNVAILFGPDIVAG